MVYTSLLRKGTYSISLLPYFSLIPQQFNPPTPLQLDAQYLLLIRLYKHEAILKLALPMLKSEGFPVLLSVINLIYQVTFGSLVLTSFNYYSQKS